MHAEKNTANHLSRIRFNYKLLFVIQQFGQVMLTLKRFKIV